MKTRTLVIEPRDLEHPLFRAAMQVVVGIEQGHVESAMKGYARTLKERVAEIHASTFTPSGA